MDRPDRPSPYDSPRIAEPSPRAEERGVMELTRDMISEARVRVEADRRAAASRSALTRALLGLTLFATLVSAGAFGYGVYTFRSGPIRPVAGGYVDKTGTPRTRADYDAFRLWSVAAWTLFPINFVLACTFGYFDTRDRRRAARGE